MFEEPDREEMTLPRRFNINCCQLICVCVFWGEGWQGVGCNRNGTCAITTVAERSAGTGSNYVMVEFRYIIFFVRMKLMYIFMNYG
jgi:hypothetical protein